MSLISESDCNIGYSLNQVFALSDEDFDKAPLNSIADHDRSRILNLLKQVDSTQSAVR